MSTTQTPRPQEGLMQLIGTAGVIAEKAAQLEATVEREKQAAADRIPACVDALIACGLLKETEKQAALQQLGRHDLAIEIMTNFANSLADQREKQASAGGVPSLGQSPSQQGRPTREYDSRTSPYVGGRSTEKSASYKAFRNALGLPSV